MAVYWLGAPGVSQLEYPPGSGTLYGLGDLIPGMSESEAQSLVPLGHSFEIPTVFPYGTPYMEPAPSTTRRVGGTAQRTGEPQSAGPGVIVGGAAPQALWSRRAEYQPEPLPVEVDPGQMLGTAAPQADWSTTSGSSGTVTTTTEPEVVTEPLEGQLVAVAVRDPAYQPPVVPVTAELEAEPEPEVVAVATPDPDAPLETEPEPEPELEPEAELEVEPEPALDPLELEAELQPETEPLEELPNFTA